MSYSLRPYQSKAIDDLYAWFETHHEGHPIVEACVASGKSVMIAELCRRALAEFEGTRILMVVHVKELVEQNLEKLLALWPDAPVGLCSASLNKTNTSAQILFGTIQTIGRRVEAIGHADLLIVDECHMINTKEAGTYRKTIAAFTQINPSFRVIGFTGTPFRGNGIYLTDAESPLFTHVTSRVRIPEMMRDKYLSEIVTVKTQTQSDVSGVDIDAKTGDYKLDQLSRALNQDGYIKPAVAEAIALAEGRKRIMVFCADIAHCKTVAAEFESRGESVRFLTSLNKAKERAEIIEQFRAGEFRWLVNVAILTTGFDVPDIDCICLMRNTVSPVLYVQIVGRGLRTAKHKDNCLWLDFTDTTARQGPVDSIKGRPRPKLKSPVAAPFKLCPDCGSQCATASLSCPECGFTWPVRERVYLLSDAPIMESQVKATWVNVHSVVYSVHQKHGKPPTIKVDYRNQIMSIAKEYLSVHEDAAPFAFRKACQWINTRLPKGTHFSRLITTEGMQELADKMQETLRNPTRIKVKKEGAFWTVTDHEFKTIEGEEIESV